MKLPDGWLLGDIAFLLERLKQGPIFIKASHLGVPHLAQFAEFSKRATTADVYGPRMPDDLYEIKTPDYTLYFIYAPGTPLRTTPSGHEWFHLQVTGEYDQYDTEKVRKTLRSYLPEEFSAQFHAMTQDVFCAVKALVPRERAVLLHEIIVRRCIDDLLDVPLDVLSQYPHLMQSHVEHPNPWRLTLCGYPLTGREVVTSETPNCPICLDIQGVRRKDLFGYLVNERQPHEMELDEFKFLRGGFQGARLIRRSSDQVDLVTEHRQYVEEALGKGVAVHPKILNQYPNLAARDVMVVKLVDGDRVRISRWFYENWLPSPVYDWAISNRLTNQDVFRQQIEEVIRLRNDMPDMVQDDETDFVRVPTCSLYKARLDYGSGRCTRGKATRYVVIRHSEDRFDVDAFHVCEFCYVGLIRHFRRSLVLGFSSVDLATHMRLAAWADRSWEAVTRLSNRPCCDRCGQKAQRDRESGWYLLAASHVHLCPACIARMMQWGEARRAEQRAEERTVRDGVAQAASDADYVPTIGDQEEYDRWEMSLTEPPRSKTFKYALSQIKRLGALSYAMLMIDDAARHRAFEKRLKGMKQ